MRRILTGRLDRTGKVGYRRFVKSQTARKRRRYAKVAPEVVPVNGTFRGYDG